MGEEGDGELLAADPVYDAVELFQVGGRVHVYKPCGCLCLSVCLSVRSVRG